MAHDKNIYINYAPISLGQFAYTIDGSAHEIQGVGEVSIVLPNVCEQIISNVYYIPNMQCNLFSVKQLAEVVGQFCIARNIASSKHDLIATCILDQDLYTLGYSKVPQYMDITNNTQMALTTTISENLTSIWHNCFGLINLKHLQDLINHHKGQRNKFKAN